MVIVMMMLVICGLDVYMCGAFKRNDSKSPHPKTLWSIMRIFFLFVWLYFSVVILWIELLFWLRICKWNVHVWSGWCCLLDLDSLFVCLFGMFGTGFKLAFMNGSIGWFELLRAFLYAFWINVWPVSVLIYPMWAVLKW